MQGGRDGSGGKEQKNSQANSSQEDTGEAIYSDPQTELQVGTSSHFDSGDENSSPSLKYQSANRLSLQVLFKHL